MVRGSAIPCLRGCHRRRIYGQTAFLIFDYCGNFEFFRQKPNGYESADTKSLSESIFCKQVRIAAALQDGAYADENYQNWRKILTETCRAEVGR